MPNVNDAVAWAEGIAADDRYGYDQADRDTGHAVDCSSLVCRGLRHAGFGAPSPSFSTRTMGAWLTSHDWVWHTGISGVRRGDILWMTGHTAFAASATTIVEAYPHGTPLWGDERGDNNGREVLVDKLTVHNWAGYWRYTGDDDEVTDADIEKIAERVWNYAIGTDATLHKDNQEAWKVLCSSSQPFRDCTGYSLIIALRSGSSCNKGGDAFRYVLPDNGTSCSLWTKKAFVPCKAYGGSLCFLHIDIYSRGGLCCIYDKRYSIFIGNFPGSSYILHRS